LRYIAIEGPIGVGKTSLARLLADLVGADLVLEEPEDNPFLPDFYSDSERWSLQTQLSFLISRHQQQVKMRQMGLFQNRVVSDYIFEKDAIFARLTLKNRDLELYRRISELLTPETARPDLVVFLQASPEHLLANIRIRDLEYERDITLDYLTELCATYNRFFAHWNRSALLTVRASALDFINNPDHQKRLIDRILSVTDSVRGVYPEE
jgi:deoxyadenosine/deoxycytidine kinase